MFPALRELITALYGATAIRSMEAAPRPDGRDWLALSPDRVAIATAPPAALTHSADPANDDSSPDTLTIIADEAEAARFAAEIERDAALGDHADWPDL
jgi:hypothetical protein